MTRVFLLTLLGASLALGCSDDDSAGGAGGAGPGRTIAVKGPKAQEAANAYVIWGVSSTSPDYSYRFGSGTSSGGQLSLSLPGDASGTVTVPDEALNTYNASKPAKLGVGQVVLMKSDTTLPEGKLSLSKEDVAKAIGLSARYSFIYRADDGSAEDIAWIGKFPQGLSCGRCVPAAESQTFDTFEPVDCASMEVETADDLDSLDVCNWT